jgi:hypothetical protein
MRKDIRELQPEQLASVTGGSDRLGVYKPGFRFRDASLRFFRECVGEETYSRAMNSEAGKRHHYVVARAFLSQSDWEKFVWIEQYGTLAGFPE